MTLIERLEKATGPDRELEVEIWLAITDGSYRKKWSYTHSATGRLCEIDETRDKFGHLVLVPDYTSSIDAAMTLVPPNHLHMVGNAGLSDGAKEYRADVWGLEPRSSHIGLHDCEAIALCIAALRALEAKQGSAS